MIRIEPVIEELALLFHDHELYQVGGSVRNYFLGIPSPDYDLATDARPDEIMNVVRDWADDIWEVGRTFGTIGMMKNGNCIEITTYRKDAYDGESRKPVVEFGTSLADDLSRRDFTVNAMAIDMRGNLIDPFGGLKDLNQKILRTPGEADISINDDPLRILRAARFVSQFDMAPDPGLRLSMISLAHKLGIVSRERISMELEKLILSDDPIPGLNLLKEIGVLGTFFTSSIQMLREVINAERDYQLDHDLILRLAALLHDEPEPKHKLRLLRFPNDVCRGVDSVLKHHTYFPSDLHIRKMIVESGSHLMRVVALSEIEFPGHLLSRRVRDITMNEDLSDPLSGQEIMEVLKIRPGTVVGKAKAHLRELLYKNGPMSKKEAIDAFLRWAWDQEEVRPHEYYYDGVGEEVCSYTESNGIGCRLPEDNHPRG